MADTKSSPKTENKLNIKPVAGYILVEPQESEKTTASGIVLPDTVSADKPQQGKVIAVGEAVLHESGEEKVESPCKLGDIVVYKKWGGNEYKDKPTNKEYMFVKFDDILAIVG